MNKEQIIKAVETAVEERGCFLVEVTVSKDNDIEIVIEKEEAILDDMAAWLSVNGEAIYGTRPWKVFGEGDGIRFTTKDDAIYAHLLDLPAQSNEVVIKSLTERPGSVHMLGYDAPLEFTCSDEGLKVMLPSGERQVMPIVLKIL